MRLALQVLVLDANRQPELEDFLKRMRSSVTSAEDQEKWESLPPVMRSAGDNPLSDWVKYTCEGRACYRCEDPVKWSLEPPSEGVRQLAVIGMPGLPFF